MTTIKPTIGRVVWYQPDSRDTAYKYRAMGDQRHSAMIAYVHSDSMVNLAVNDANGNQYAKTSVPLFQGEAEDCPPGECCWMPYQKKQAAKEE